MTANGITARMPEFMMNKFKRPNRSNASGQNKGNEEPKVLFKHFAVSKQPVTKTKKLKKDLSVALEISSPSSSMKMTGFSLSFKKLSNRKDFANSVLNTTQDSLKVLKDMLLGVNDFMDGLQFFDEDIDLSEPGSFKDILEKVPENTPLQDTYINPSEPGTSKGTRNKARYPQRNVPRKSYAEEDVSSEDEFLFCDICNDEHKGLCPVHGPMLLVCDKKIPKGDSDRARKTLPPFLSIGISSLPGAGLGVWTEEPLIAGMVFGPYEGCVVKKNKEAKKSGYAWQVRKHSKSHHYVEGADKNNSNWMRYVNCANQEDWQNVIAFQFLGKIYYRTYKNILPYTEILVWYGDDYGAELGFQIRQKKTFQKPREITGFSCDVCHGLFSSSESLKNHQKIHPRTLNEKGHLCPECSYSTDNTGHLHAHLLTHSGEKPHACPHCTKRFNVKCNLQKHILVHTGEKEHVCSTCGKQFTQKGNLLRHERVHSGERPYRCPDCGKDFTQASNLKGHLRLHTRQRPYPCPHCERRFTRSGDLTRHISSIHTRVFPHNCSLCGKGFRVPGELKKHAEKQHNKVVGAAQQNTHK